MSKKEEHPARSKPIKCICKNNFMDNTYGKGMRIHNKMKEVSGMPDKGRCTVCGDIKNWGT